MKSILLIGFATAGKSTIGQRLANQLGCNFIDCDQLLVAQQGKSIAQLFEGGEQHFRWHENAMLATLPTTHAVIACGGGAVLCDNFSSLANSCDVVWLDIDANTCLARLGQTKRPLQDGKSPTELAAMLQQRNDLYAKYSTIKVDATASMDEVFSQILDKLSI